MKKMPVSPQIKLVVLRWSFPNLINLRVTLNNAWCQLNELIVENLNNLLNFIGYFNRCSNNIMRVFLSMLWVFAILWAPTSWAQQPPKQELPTGMLTDIKLSVVGRSYPIGAMALGQFGVAKRIWEVSSSLQGPTAWQYGYVRAALNVGTSGVVNRIGPEFQFFPISVFGISVGYDVGTRWFKPKWVDCNTYTCWGRIDRPYLRAQAFAAVQNIVFSMNARLDRTKTFSNQSQFFDEMAVLTGKASGEKVLTLNPALLYRIHQEWGLGYTSILTQALESHHLAHMYGLITQVQLKPETSLVVGLGQNRSPLVPTAWNIFMMYQYTLKAGEPITDLALRAR